MRHEWGLDPDFLTVNHGSYGATPRVVLAEQDRWRSGWRRSRRASSSSSCPARCARPPASSPRFLGAEAKDIAFVPNATTGCNAVLRSLRLEAGDEILMLSHVYNAVRNTIRHVAEQAGARRSWWPTCRFRVPTPSDRGEHRAGDHQAHAHRRHRPHHLAAARWCCRSREIVRLCHAAGVPVLVDGAHGPGQVALDLPALGADWYVGNCHKWLCAPKGCGFLYARADRRADLHPVTISHG